MWKSTLCPVRGSAHVALWLVLGLALGCAEESPTANDEPVAVIKNELVTSTTVTLQDGTAGYVGTRDTYLSQSSSYSNYGTRTTLYVDGDDPTWTGRDLSTLLHFDVSRIPEGAVVTSAALTLYVTDSAATGYPIFGMNRPWDELQASWTKATTSVYWQTSGAKGNSDRATNVLGSFVAPTVGATTVNLNANGLAQVQAWVNAPTTNYGFVIASPSLTDKLAFYSREATNVSRRPKFVVTYSLTTPDCIAPSCCASDAACNDGNACTTDACIAGSCSFSPLASCCTSDGDCADSNPCTTDTCVGGQCAHSVISGCCQTDTDCADGNLCTSDACTDSLCTHLGITGCCTSDADCNDGNSCTSDVCSAGGCAALAIAGCCLSDVECGDTNACTSDACIASQCSHTAVAGCCVENGDCSDGNACTSETCTEHSCVVQVIPGCCLVDSECEDPNSCTSDSCVGHTCQHTPLAGCCSDSVECSDGNVCTLDSCENHACAFSPVLGCCTTDADCFDADTCTADICTANLCVHSAIPECCTTDKTCDDMDVCTTDRCLASACSHEWIPGGTCGCATDANCTDAKDCTIDTCVAGICSHVEAAPGACGCESDATCDDGNPCTIDVCSKATCHNSVADCSDGDPSTADLCADGYCTHDVPVTVTKTYRNGENAYLGATDTKIAQYYPTTNFGTATVLVVDGDEPSGGGSDVATLIRWGNLDVPAGSTVTAASLTLYIGGGTNSASASAYLIHALNRDWSSAHGTWEMANSTQTWSTSGASGALDRDVTTLGSTPVSVSGSVTIPLNSVGVAKVQSWLDDPTSNFGIIIESSTNTDGLSIYSSEYGTIGYRPMLSVTYSGVRPTVDPVSVSSSGNSPRYGFFVYSDSHVDAATNPVFSSALAQMRELKNAEGAPPIIAAMSLGDHTENGLDASWDWHTAITSPYWDAGATSFGGALPRYIAVSGNHDASDSANWYSYWSEHLPGQASLGGNSSSSGVYYAFTHANALFVGLDTNKATNTSTSYQTDPQLQLLRSSLVGATTPFKFMFYHMPAFYCGSGGMGVNAASVAFMDLAAQNNVDAVFNGHSHVYSRTCRMTKSHVCTETNAGAVQVEVGTVGATDARLRALKTTAQTVTGYDASGLSTTTSYTCSSSGGYVSTLGSRRTFCYVNVRGCWAKVNCYEVGIPTPFDSWTINHCP